MGMVFSLIWWSGIPSRPNSYGPLGVYVLLSRLIEAGCFRISLADKRGDIRGWGGFGLRIWRWVFPELKLLGWNVRKNLTYIGRTFRKIVSVKKIFSQGTFQLPIVGWNNGIGTKTMDRTPDSSRSQRREKKLINDVYSTAPEPKDRTFLFA